MFNAEEARERSTRNKIAQGEADEQSIRVLREDIERSLETCLDRLIENAVARGKDNIVAVLRDDISCEFLGGSRTGHFYLTDKNTDSFVDILNIRDVSKRISVDEAKTYIVSALENLELHERYAAMGYQVELDGIVRKRIVIGWKE